MNKKYSLIVMLLFIALFAVACGGGAPAEVEEAPVEEAPAEVEAPAEEPVEEPDRRTSSRGSARRCFG